MDSEDNITVELAGYEKAIVEQFHIMERLIEVSTEERELILKGSPEALMKNTEEKEAILDRFSLMEENSRMFLQKIALTLKIHTEKTNIQSILPYLNAEESAKIKRLLDGINILVSNAKELNLGNQALAMTRMDWLRATQAFISSIIQKDENYAYSMNDGVNRNLAVSGMEFRA